MAKEGKCFICMPSTYTGRKTGERPNHGAVPLYRQQLPVPAKSQAFLSCY